MKSKISKKKRGGKNESNLYKMDDILYQKAFDDLRKPQEINNYLIGICDAENGDSIYGNEKKYSKNKYLGRVRKGAQLKLINPIPQKNEFGIYIILVEVLTNNFGYIGKRCWVGLNSTTFRENFDSSQKMILTNTQIKSKSEKQTEKIENISNENIIGLVTNVYGDAIYGNSDSYCSDLYLGRLKKNDKIKLMENKVYKNEFNLPIIKVKVISNKSYEGKIVWVNLDCTNFQEYYNSKLQKIIIIDGKNEVENKKNCNEDKLAIHNNSVFVNQKQKILKKASLFKKKIY